jgi:hypothetical protein
MKEMTMTPSMGRIQAITDKNKNKLRKFYIMMVRCYNCNEKGYFWSILTRAQARDCESHRERGS